MKRNLKTSVYSEQNIGSGYKPGRQAAEAGSKGQGKVLQQPSKQGYTEHKCRDRKGQQKTQSGKGKTDERDKEGIS